MMMILVGLQQFSSRHIPSPTKRAIMAISIYARPRNNRVVHYCRSGPTSPASHRLRELRATALCSPGATLRPAQCPRLRSRSLRDI
ncbi:hypothetical protein EVAR_55203_1 [Eumeta japonica]|uniref:Uncharacterized protein n=1 Tax=Eumeta variegata TaxID=151549 RepID=A0A4C1ZDI0_EUMVA|nr:hypothetical protein EVAR_55203_1 [Eumeta japonica]